MSPGELPMIANQNLSSSTGGSHLAQVWVAEGMLKNKDYLPFYKKKSKLKILSYIQKMSHFKIEHFLIYHIFQ